MADRLVLVYYEPIVGQYN